jgi:quinol monooxygenase YgiN
MPTMPWSPVAPVNPSTDYLIMATRFTVVHRHDLARVLAATNTLWSGFGRTPGLIGYSLSSSVIRGTLATLSAWENQDTMHAFVRGPAHQEVIARTRERLRESTITSWQAAGADVPPDWATAERELDKAARLSARGELDD